MAQEAAKREEFQKLLTGMDQDTLLQFAKVCENAERFEDMSDVMKQIVVKSNKGKDLKEDHQALMSVAFKNVVGDLRKAMRKLEVESFDDKMADLHKSYKKRIVEQVKNQCKGVINLLKDNLIDAKFVEDHNKAWDDIVKQQGAEAKEAKDSSGNLQQKFEEIITAKLTDRDDVENWIAYKIKLEAQTFFLKMLGDYWRYLSEAEQTEDSVNQADENYTNAWKMAKSFMAPTHPTRLGLALNSSVFVQEIQRNTNKAQRIAKEAFESAIQSLDTLNDTSYKDSTLIMQLLRDNLTIWQDSGDKQQTEED
jgi:hypothetical protein